MIGLIDTATIYTPHGTTGVYSVLAQADLSCRLAVINVEAGRTEAGIDRGELLADRRFLWDPAYDMPENVQIDIDGTRWNPVPGTFAAVRGPGGAVEYRRCSVVRAV